MDVESGTVSGPLGTVLRISSVLGLAPLRVSAIPNASSLEPHPRLSHLHQSDLAARQRIGYTIAVSRPRAVLGFILIFITVSLQLFSIVVYMVGINEVAVRIRSGLSLVCFILMMLTSSAALMVGAFDGINRMKRLISYLNKIEEINEDLGSSYTDLKITYGRIVVFGFLTWVFIYFGYITHNVIRYAIASKDNYIYTILKFAKVFGYLSNHLSQLLLMMQFVFVVCTVTATLRELNGRLQSLIYKMKLYESMKSKPMTYEHTTVRRLSRVYMSISELVGTIDRGEGALVFIIIVAKILDFMDSVYFILSTLTLPSEWTFLTSLKFGMTLYWALYKASLLILLAEPCQLMQDEFQKVQILVSQLMCSSSERRFRDEMSRYHDLVVDNVPCFSPLGMFALSRKFIVTVIGGLSSFLAIILQFNLKDGLVLDSV